MMVLRPRHLRAIALLVETDLLQKDVAAEVGVSPRTIGRWIKDETFAAELTRRREVQPYCIDGLRLEAARAILCDLAQRVESGEARIPAKEIPQLLTQLVGREFERASLGESATPEETPVEEDDDPFPTYTPEEAEAIWAARERPAETADSAVGARERTFAPSTDDADASSRDTEATPPDTQATQGDNTGHPGDTKPTETDATGHPEPTQPLQSAAKRV